MTSWSSHEGEEFILVLKGLVELHTEFYEPARLEAGDSAYIDSGMASHVPQPRGGRGDHGLDLLLDAIDRARPDGGMPIGETAEP